MKESDTPEIVSPLKPPRRSLRRRLATPVALIIAMVAGGVIVSSHLRHPNTIADRPAALSSESETAVAPGDPPPLSPDQRDQNLLGQARECSDAFNRKDWDKLANLTYEPVVKLVGGHDAMVKLLSRESQGAEADEFPPGEVSIGDIKQIVSAGGNIFATVEQDMTMGTPAGDCYVAAWTLGISADGGRQWKFAGIAANTVRMRKMLPEIPAELILLKQSKPQLIKPRAVTPAAK